jgi:recombination protein RecA
MTMDLRELLASAKGSAATARILRPDQLITSTIQPPRWSLDALRGRLIELSARGATATLTAAIDLVLAAQHAAEPVAWMMLPHSSFYPPDVAASGVDLAALAVVRVADPTGAASAAARMLRSGAFGLVVLDFGGCDTVELAMAQQGRLVTLAQTHDAAVVCLTDKAADASSLGSLVSLRAEAMRRCDPGPAADLALAVDRQHDVTLRVLKDKQRGPGWSHKTTLWGPPGF